MLYDRDIDYWGIRGGKLCIEYFTYTEQAIFTREDLVFFFREA